MKSYHLLCVGGGGVHHVARVKVLGQHGGACSLPPHVGGPELTSSGLATGTIFASPGWCIEGLTVPTPGHGKEVVSWNPDWAASRQ